MNVTGAAPTPQKCSLCGGFFTGPHYCPGHQAPFGFGAFPAPPLTEDRVRKIVRDELAKRGTVASVTSGMPTPEGSCAVCGKLFRDHGSYPTCADHNFTSSNAGVPGDSNTVDGTRNEGGA